MQFGDVFVWLVSLVCSVKGPIASLVPELSWDSTMSEVYIINSLQEQSSPDLRLEQCPQLKGYIDCGEEAEGDD